MAEQNGGTPEEELADQRWLTRDAVVGGQLVEDADLVVVVTGSAAQSTKTAVWTSWKWGLDGQGRWTSL